MRSLIIFALYCDDHIKDKMGRALTIHGQMINAYKILVGSLKGRDYLEDQGIDERLILKWILMKSCRWVWTGFISLGAGISGGLLWTQ
jgi:hypothetical protein